MADLARLVSSPKSLLVFDAAARHGSFSRAAQDFNISQPSISRNIAQLEHDVGQKLFFRGAKGARLTEAGQALFAATQPALLEIAEAIQTLQAEGPHTREEVVLSLSNAFVTNWLAPRLGDLSRGFPEVALRFELVAGTRRSVAGEVDLATLITGNEPQGYTLAPEVIVPVCSPAYIAAHGILSGDAQTAAQHTFLHLADHPAAIWDQVLGPGVAARSGVTWHAFSDYAAIIQAAQDGTGIALGWINVVAGSLRSGRLVPAWEGRWVETGRIIDLFSTRSQPMRPVVRDIAQWLCARMADDLEEIASQGCGPPVSKA